MRQHNPDRGGTDARAQRIKKRHTTFSLWMHYHHHLRGDKPRDEPGKRRFVCCAHVPNCCPPKM